MSWGPICASRAALMLIALVASCSKFKPVEVDSQSQSATGPSASPGSQTSVPAPSASAVAEPPAPARDVCKLVAKEDVKRAMSLDVRRAEARASEGFDACEFRDWHDQSVFVAVYKTAAAFENQKREDAVVLGAKAERVEGLGDEAFVIEGKQMGFPSVVVGAAKGGVRFTASATAAVGAAGGSEKRLKNSVIDLVRVIAGKL